MFLFLKNTLPLQAEISKTAKRHETNSILSNGSHSRHNV